MVLDATREDGYFDGTLTIQGVRAYDPNMNQWTTPDAYAGEVHDPMSQHPYMWNNNNPVQYSDPSGYCPSDPNSALNDPCLPTGLGKNHAEELSHLSDRLGDAESWTLGLVLPGGDAAAGAKAAVLAGKVEGELAGAIMSITDLGNIANSLFRTVDTIVGGTAAALRHETATGELVGGKSHFEKTLNSINAISNWLSKNAATASKNDLAAANAMLDDLQNALESMMGPH